MGRIPNHTFSKRADRQLTSHEARLEKFKGWPLLRQTSNMSNKSRKKNDGNSDGDGSINGVRVRNGSVLTLGPYTNAAREALADIERAQASLRGLSQSYEKHLSEIGQAGEWMQRCKEMELRAKEHEEEVAACNTTIAKLTKMNREDDRRRQEEWERIEVEKSRIDAAHEKVKKRQEALEQQQKHQLDEEMQKLKWTQEEELRIKKTKMDEMAKKKEKDNEKKLADLQLNTDKLSAELEKLRQQNTEQQVRLEDTEDALDDAKRVKKSVSEENKLLHGKLHDIKKSFGLSSRPPEFYSQRFSEIQKNIEAISIDYLREMNPNDEDFNLIHERLREIDAYWAVVPISASPESRQLCQAHIQRVISAYICKYIWRRFSSERTFQYQQFAQLLEDLSIAVAKHGHPSGRTALAWKTQTMQALLSLPAALPTRNQGNSTPSRIGRVVGSVVSVLKPLIDQTKMQKFREALLNVSKSAVSAWDCAQIDELEFFVSTSLELSRYSEHRSELFDPESASKDQNNTSTTSSGQIYTLFPRIIAQRRIFEEANASVMPGTVTDGYPQTIEILIHPGVGLAKSSALAVQGKSEVDGLYDAIASTKRSWRAGEATPRRPNTAGSVSMQWMGMHSMTSLPIPLNQA